MAEMITISDCTLYVGDVLEVLATLPDESVQCCVTSPPYWGLRDYGTTCAVAHKLGRASIGIELSKEYAKLAENRIGEAAHHLFAPNG